VALGNETVASEPAVTITCRVFVPGWPLSIQVDFLESVARARLLRLLEEAHEDLAQAGGLRARASKRWQAHYDFLLARLELQIAHCYEYASALGSLRRELPPRDPQLHRGWRLASSTKLQGDPVGRKMAKHAARLLDRLIQEHAGTPWEILARRQKLTAVGLEWVPEP